MELATEQLSEYLERDINTSELKAIQEIKQKVQDKYRCVKVTILTCLQIDLPWKPLARPDTYLASFFVIFNFCVDFIFHLF